MVGQILPSNPASSVRGPKHVVTRGKTTCLNQEETRDFLTAIDASTVLGLRDRALMGVMVYSFARVGAVVRMEVQDYVVRGRRALIRLHEKGGRQHEVPAHHKLEKYLDAHMDAAEIGDQRDTPLFRSTYKRSGQLTERPMSRTAAFKMIRRRAVDAGPSPEISCHSFRATGITNYLQHGGTLEHAQQIAGHSSPRTTKLYDRSFDEVCLDEIERIQF